MDPQRLWLRVFRETHHLHEVISMAQRACLPGCDSDTLMERRALADRRPGGNPVFEQMVADHLRVVGPEIREKYPIHLGFYLNHNGETALR